MQRIRSLTAFLVCLTVVSPEAHALEGSPSLPFAGAYFPFWLVSAFGGILAVVLLRIVLIRLGIDDVLPLRLLVYVALAAAIALGLARVFYGR